MFTKQRQEIEMPLALPSTANIHDRFLCSGDLELGTGQYQKNAKLVLCSTVNLLPSTCGRQVALFFSIASYYIFGAGRVASRYNLRNS